MTMLPFRAVLLGSIARFLPASLISIAALLVGLGMPLTAFATDPYPLWSAKMAVALTAGYLAGLDIVRRLAPAVAGIDGWRSLLAGLAAPLPYLLVGSLGSPFNPPWGPLQALGWMGLCGAAMAVLAYLPRRTGWPRLRQKSPDGRLR